MRPPDADDRTRTAAVTPEVTVSALASSPADGDTVAAKPGRAGDPGLPSIPGYVIEGVLGRGGMGVVYRARQVSVNRVVALKMLLHSRHASLQEQVRFQIEAEAVARLQHPNVVQLLEVGEHDGLPFLALEFCDGGSLADADRGPLPPVEAARLVEVLARGVHHAHLRGVIHRDLKPANVLLTADGTPKITDFGLAKQLDSASDLSQSGAVMGTPAYMAPEQAAGRVRDTGPPTDVYALGAMLYELLAGQPPFRGASVVDTTRMVLTEEPVPPSRVRAGIPRDLETVCLKCLAKAPARRYATAEALADDLRRFQRGEPVSVRRAGAVERVFRWARRRPTAAALVLVAVLGVAGVVWKYLDAEHQRRVAVGKQEEAQREAEKAKKARDFLVSIFELSDTRTERGAVTARQILDDAERRIPREFADQPELQAELMAAVEGVLDKLTADSPLAMVTEVTGEVRLEAARDPGRRVAPRTLLYPGDRLTPAAGALVRLVFLYDFHTERLTPGATATVARRGCSPAEAVAERYDDLMLPFVALPTGTFYMGYSAVKNTVNGEVEVKRGVKTEVTEPFEIGVYTVTQGQWLAVMGGNPSFHSHLGNFRGNVRGITEEELRLHPVEGVSWDDVQEFVQRLNDRNRGRGWRYRLPTSTEWEYACRGGPGSEERGSHNYYLDTPADSISTTEANFNGQTWDGNTSKGTYLNRTTRVGAYPPNELGLCDMHGNVWQWCQDRGEQVGEMVPRHARGGGYFDIPRGLQAGYVYQYRQDLRVPTNGLRLVRVPER